MHQLARQLHRRHCLQVVTQWDEVRTDWLLGTTLNAPRDSRTYEIDSVQVRRISMPETVRRRLLPWVLAYYPLQGFALSHIASALADEVFPWTERMDLVHNCRIGREGLSYASLAAARRRGIPFVLTPVHHPRWGGWLHRFYHRLYRQADAVVALTDSERQTLARLGVDERRIFVLGHGPIIADSHDALAFRRMHRLEGRPVVLFLGQKYHYKGLRLLLDAATQVWPRVPDAHFVFVGPRTPYSIRLFAGVSDPRVVELDAVDLQEKTNALAACDLLCLPSTQESFGGVFTEAWSLGKPVVGCDIPAVREVVDNGGNGYLVRPQAGALAERILYLLEHPQIAQALGQSGQEKVNRLYTWPRLAERTEQIYEHVLNAS
jgi:glycosyltransferase involved in cell wall biosynthesis